MYMHTYKHAYMHMLINLDDNTEIENFLEGVLIKSYAKYHLKIRKSEN